VGRGTLEEIGPGGETLEKIESGDKKTPDEESALAEAEAEIRVLRSELRARETNISEFRSSVAALKDRMDSLKSDLESEKSAFYESARKEAEEQKAASEKEGRAEGYSSGYADGLAKSEAFVRSEYEGKFKSALSALSGIIDALTAAREKLALSHAPQLVRLWETMLQRMLLVRTELDPDSAKRILEYILKRVSDREKIIVYLNPADISSVEAGKEDLMDAIRGVKSFEILSDDHVDRGSCLIETNLGIYDARWRTQLEQVSVEVQNLLMECMAKNDQYNGD
jgi:flagellar assembly protein FliH